MKPFNQMNKAELLAYAHGTKDGQVAPEAELHDLQSSMADLEHDLEVARGLAREKEAQLQRALGYIDRVKDQEREPFVQRAVDIENEGETGSEQVLGFTEPQGPDLPYKPATIGNVLKNVFGAGGSVTKSRGTSPFPPHARG